MGNFRKFGGVSSPLHVEPEVNKAMSGSNEFFSSTFRRVIKISIREVLKEPTLHADSTIPAACAGEQNIIMKPMQFGRGLGREEKLRAVRNIIFEHRLNLICLQETKLNVLNPSIHCKLWNGPGIMNLFCPSSGSARGLTSMWNFDVFGVTSQCISQRFIAIIGHLKNQNFECGFLNLYGPSVEVEKGLFFSEIYEFLANYNLP
ncbi:hypothetical protein V6N11_064426 [Hibiscus sabdariffa]|uniref:Uncharacterized protein n=1 Tax=Hibiscus sabdariffa TaxID=183260 RepID=A0ABR2P8X8_9ROSI